MQAFRGNDIVGKLQGKCLRYSLKSPNLSNVYTRHRGQLIQVGCLSVRIYRCLAIPNEYSQEEQPTFFIYNVISHWLSEENRLKFAIMKNLLFSVLFFLVSLSTFAQLNYRGWQVKDPMYGYDHYAPHDFVSFQNKGNGSYRIIGWGENKGSIVLDGKFTYAEKDDKDYIYSGTLSYGKLYCETVLLRTQIKLSEYSGSQSVSLYNVLRFVLYAEDEQGNFNSYRLLKLTLLD